VFHKRINQFPSSPYGGFLCAFELTGVLCRDLWVE